MALAHFEETFTDTAGNVLPSLTVTIRNESTGALAALYTDSAGTTPTASPGVVVTDAFGTAGFYVEAGRYRITHASLDRRNVELVGFPSLAQAVTDAGDAAQTVIDAGQLVIDSSVADAQAAEAGAQSAEAGALEARDAAQATAGIYDDTTAGLAATVDGEYFTTPSAAENGALTLYRNDAGVATEISTILTSTVTTSTGTQTLSAALDDRAIILTSDLTVNIPTDYATIQAAVDELSGKYRPADGVTITLMLESGYAIPAGVVFSNYDYRNYQISSVDATVLLSGTFVGVNPTSDVFVDNSLFVAVNATAPKLNCLINMADLYGCGYVLKDQSSGKVSGSCGVINAGAFGLYVSDQSRCRATGCNFRGAGWGNRVTTNSMLDAPVSDFSRAKNQKYPAGTLTSTTANMDVSRGSVVYITGQSGALTDLTQGAGHGLHVRRSFCSASLANASNNGLSGVISSAGSHVTFNAGFANVNADYGLVAQTGSTLDAADSQATDAGIYGGYANAGGRLCADGSDFRRAGTNGVRADKGGTITCYGVECRLDNTLPGTANDIVVTNGGVIHAVGAFGGTSITPLTLTVSGLIYK